MPFPNGTRADITFCSFLAIICGKSFKIRQIKQAQTHKSESARSCDQSTTKPRLIRPGNSYSTLVVIIAKSKQTGIGKLTVLLFIVASMGTGGLVQSGSASSVDVC